MKPVPRVDDRSRLLGSARPRRRDRLWGALALLGFALTVVLATAVIPPLRPSLDFRHAATPEPGTAPAADGPAPITQWSDLMPKGWTVARPAPDAQPAHAQLDAEPRARTALRSLRDQLDAAPTDPALDGRAARIAGYVVPIDASPHGTVQFLLVPYFGACIHAPPPPANQIIHVVLGTPMSGLRAMDTVSVRGVLHVVRHDTALATSGYRLAASAVEPYQSDARRAGGR